VKIFKEVFKHKGHTVYQINKKVVIIKELNKIKFYFKGIGFANLRFKLGKFIFIRLPFFYLEKNNGGISFGLPNFYLWIIR